MHQCCLPHPGLGKGSVRVGRNSFRIRAVTHFADDAHSSRCPASFGPAGPVTGCTTVRRHIGGADESPQPEISPASEVTERPSVVVIQRNAQHWVQTVPTGQPPLGCHVDHLSVIGSYQLYGLRPLTPNNRLHEFSTSWAVTF